MKNHLMCLLAASALACGSTNPLFAQGTAVTYQGRLDAGTNPASGSYDFRFALFNAASSGAQVGPTLSNAAVIVNHGLFTTSLDFGSNIFTGLPRWLEISVRTNGLGAFTGLTPRQELKPTPYALYTPTAGTAASAISASSVAANAVGTSGLQNSAVTSLKIADGTIASGDLSAALLHDTFWRLLGNAGTTAGINFLGTTDNQPLELKVNGQRAFRLEPTASSPNVIGGNNNTVAGLGGFVGAGSGHTIGFNRFSTIAGGESNTISGGLFPIGHEVIGGGLRNSIQDGFYAFLGGGQDNRIFNECSYGSLTGGRNNQIDRVDYATIGGGLNNSIVLFGLPGHGQYATIGGGGNNSIKPTGDGNTIAGGMNNTISASSIDTPGATIGGGAANFVDGNYGTISGGQNNQNRGNYATVSGGEGNAASEAYAMVGGGQGNVSGGSHMTVGGGENNSGNSSHATVGGGARNAISFANYATIAGGQSNRIYAASLPLGHEVIGGGLRNFISDGYYSIIGGGQANLIGGICSYGTVSGGYSNEIYRVENATIAGGEKNVITPGGIPGFNSYATIGGGRNNTNASSGPGSTIAGGVQNRISASASSSDGGETISGGIGNSVTDMFGTIPGGTRAAARSYGQMAYASGRFTQTGDAQTSLYVTRRTTTDATPTDLSLNGSVERITLPANATWSFDILITGRTSAGNSAGYHIRGVIENNAGTTGLVGAIVKTVLAEDVAAWDATIVADDTNDALVVRVTGAAATTIRWVASGRTVEVIY